MSDQKIPSDPPPEYSAAAEHGAEPRAEPANIHAHRVGGPPMRRAPLPLDLPILKYLKSKRIILASASPRRKALLAQIGLTNLEILPSTKPENLSKETHGPHEYVAATARQKCLDVYQTALTAQQTASSNYTPVPPDPDLVIAADTIIVTRDGSILEKPRSEAEHVRMLRHLRDTRAHRVLTAVCVLAPRRDARHPGYSMEVAIEETKVVFASEVGESEGDGLEGTAGGGLSDEVIDSYVRTREGADKAGGYAVQGVGGLLLVERVEGSVDNVVGLPVRRCLRLMEKVVFEQDEDGEE